MKREVKGFQGWNRNLLAAANLSPVHLSLTLNIQTELQAMYSRIKLSDNKDSQSEQAQHTNPQYSAHFEYFFNLKTNKELFSFFKK